MTKQILLRREKRVHSLREKYHSMKEVAQIDDSSPLTSVPHEIHALILENLAPASRLSFGLACKTLWEVVRQENNNECKVLITEDDKYEFSCLVSNDFPRHLLCHECKVLHRRKFDEFSIIENGGPYQVCGETRAAFPAPCLDYALSYEMLDLVLRFEELSSDHGLPHALLSHKCEVNDWKRGLLRCRVEIVPRVCEGRLLLRIDSNVDVFTEEVSYAQTAGISIPCMHTKIPQFRADCFTLLSCARRQREAGQVWYGMQRCTFCATDASMKVLLSENGRTDGLLIRAWKDFGKRGGYCKQPWVGHVATNPQTSAVYLSGEKHLGNVFDGPNAEAAEYNSQINLPAFVKRWNRNIS